MAAKETDDTGILLRVALYSLEINIGLVTIKLVFSYATGSLSLACNHLK
jgi:hypothetical protein